MKVPATLQQSYEFACHSAACRPPTSGGTGGSGGGGRAIKAGHGMGNAQGTMGQARYVRSDGTPVSKDYPGAKPFVSSRVRGGKPSAEGAKLMAQGKMVPGETPIASTTRIKGGAVHMDGKQVTGPIRKTPNGYAATMRGSEHSTYDWKKKTRVQSVVIGKTKSEVMRAAQERVMVKESAKPAAPRSKYDVMRDAQKRAGTPTPRKRKSKAKPVKRVANPTDDRPDVSGLSKAAATLAQRKATNSVS